MEKKNYEKPVMEVIRMEQEDVIRTSDPNSDNSQDVGGNPYDFGF